MIWAGHIARMGKKEIITEFWWESQKEIHQQEDSDVGRRIIIKLILEKEDGVICTGLLWVGVGTSGGLPWKW
jgi:hypothetical protein